MKSEACLECSTLGCLRSEGTTVRSICRYCTISFETLNRCLRKLSSDVPRTLALGLGFNELTTNGKAFSLVRYSNNKNNLIVGLL